jgi:hypothetical protein
MSVLSATSFTSGIDMIQARREFILYLAIAVLMLAFDRTYAIFSHGVSSLSMTLMFLPVLLGGILWVGLRWLYKERLWGHRLYRMLSFLYHSAIALLINGMLVQGILEIAQTNSIYVMLFWVLAGFVAILTVLTFYSLISSKKFKKSGMKS